jgi:hypothetical protein
MTPAARLSAAIEVLTDLIERRRPAADALKDWGLSRRFAGSKDRAAIASLVYDALRRRASSAHALGEETPRALVLGMLVSQRGMGVEEISELFNGQNHAPAPLTEFEVAGLAPTTSTPRPAGPAPTCRTGSGPPSWPASAMMRSRKGRLWRAGRLPISGPTG